MATRPFQISLQHMSNSQSICGGWAEAVRGRPIQLTLQTLLRGLLMLLLLVCNGQVFGRRRPAPQPSLSHRHSMMTQKAERQNMRQAYALGVKGPAPFWLRSAPRNTGMTLAMMIVTKVAAMSRGAFCAWAAMGSLVASSAPKAASMPSMAARPAVPWVAGVSFCWAAPQGNH